MVKSTLIFCLACAPLAAQVLPAEIRISNETAPAGGMVQLKVSLTSPKPIIIGNMSADLSGAFVDSIEGIAMFNATGDVVGAAVVKGGVINAHFTSPKGTFGSTVDYPLLTIAVRLSKFVVPGQKFTVALDPTASFWQDLLGPVSVLLTPGSITVGGSVSISNVAPGGGTLPAGGVFNVFGMGFSPNTKLTVRGLATSSIQYVSATQFRVTVKDGGLLDGTLISVQNPDKSTDSYYSYMRGVPVGVSAQPLLAQTVPIFSILTATEAVLPSTISPQLNADYFTGIALQNPSQSPVAVTIEGRSGAGALLASTVVTIPNGARFSGEASELFGATLPTGAYMHVLSTLPVQVLGLLGNEKMRIVLPIAATVLAGPAGPAPPPVTASGGGGAGSGKRP